MFGIGGQELFVILIIALLVIGPKNLPEIARTLGKAFGQFQRAADDLKREIDISSMAASSDNNRKKQDSGPSAEKASRPDESSDQKTEQPPDPEKNT